MPVLLNISFKMENKLHPYCCSSFHQLECSRDKTEFSVINISLLDKTVFVLQVRTADEFKKNGGTVMEGVITYCPFCGCNLESIIKENFEFFDKKVQEDNEYSLLMNKF